MPRDEKQFKKYDKFAKITDIFPINSVGIVTARDEFVINSDKEELKRQISMFVSPQLSDDEARQRFGLKDKSNWKIANAREKVKNNPDYENQFSQILYRPFDKQWIFYNDNVIERMRHEVMQHMLKPNLAIMTLRKGIPEQDYSWFFISNSMVSHGVYYNGNQSTEYVFPLYLYHEDKKAIFGGQKHLDLAGTQKQLDETPGKTPNIKKEIFREFKNCLWQKTNAGRDFLLHLRGFALKCLSQKIQ